MEVLASKGQRVDQIVYENFGSLDKFEEVLLLNSELKDKIFLDEGDKVTLPEISSEIQIKEDELW